MINFVYLVILLIHLVPWSHSYQPWWWSWMTMRLIRDWLCLCSLRSRSPLLRTFCRTSSHASSLFRLFTTLLEKKWSLQILVWSLLDQLQPKLWMSSCPSVCSKVTNVDVLFWPSPGRWDKQKSVRLRLVRTQKCFGKYCRSRGRKSAEVVQPSS